VTPQAFGQQLRRHREKRGVTLKQIAQQTKVAASLFASLEAGERTRWPGGIYSRGYVRAYASAVGLDPDEIVEQFCECYPDAARELPPDPIVEEPRPRPFDRLRSAVGAWLRLFAAERR
jgi:cytoskeletal protein RodZ